MSLFNLFDQKTKGKTLDAVQLTNFDNLDTHTKFEVLERYYKNNDLYTKDASLSLYLGLWREPMKGLRTCVHRSVEFYAAKICSDSPVVIAKSDAVKEAAQKFLKWSSFDSMSRVAIRQDALYGNVFQKMVITPDKIYNELIEPEYVTTFEEDSRGNILSIRIDVPTDGENMTATTYTEYWEGGPNGYVASWTHASFGNMRLDAMGTPDTFNYLREWGIDFVPIVHTKFKSFGDKWGAGSVNHAITKIDEANREATRISQIMFRYNKPIMAVMANSETPDGRPLPPVTVGNGLPVNNISDSTNSDNDLISLPGKSSIESLIPDIKYDAYLKLLENMETELEKDLPELRYYSLKEGQLSGKAISFLLAGALDTAREAQSSFVSSQERLIEMAITMGKFARIFPATVGSYESGDFQVRLMFPSIEPSPSSDEKATTLKTLRDAGVPMYTAMKIAGYSEEEVSDARAEAINTQPL